MTTATPSSGAPSIVSPREQQRARIRDRILDAASLFIETGDSRGFSADSLALRAGVARRTVFNHFASLDEVVDGVCLRRIAGVTKRVRALVQRLPAGDGGPDCIHSEIVAALRAVDGVPVIRFIERTYQFQSTRAHAARSARANFGDAEDAHVRLFLERYPAADALDVRLLVGALLSGYSTIAGEWLRASVELDPVAAQVLWLQLQERLFAQAWVGRER